MAISALPSLAADTSSNVTIEVKTNWDKVEGVSKTTPTLQVVVNPLLRRGSPIHDQAFQALHNLQADYVRFVPWYPYPKLGVAELEAPANGHTSWDFSLIDPLVQDFMDNTMGPPVVLNFSTIPQWMFKTENPVDYPRDPDVAAWNYEQGTELRDPSMKEVSDYYARVVSWYTQGGFTDELGLRTNPVIISRSITGRFSMSRSTNMRSVRKLIRAYTILCLEPFAASRLK